jgi:hypothetical protein
VCNDVCNGVPKLPLKNDQVASAIKSGAPVKLADGHGLYLVVRRPGETFSTVVSQIRLASTKRLLRRLYRMDSSVFEKIHGARAVSGAGLRPVEYADRPVARSVLAIGSQRAATWSAA